MISSELISQDAKDRPVGATTKQVSEFVTNCGLGHFASLKQSSERVGATVLEIGRFVGGG